MKSKLFGFFVVMTLVLSSGTSTAFAAKAAKGAQTSTSVISVKEAEKKAMTRVVGGTIARTETRYLKDGSLEYTVVIVSGANCNHVKVNGDTGAIIGFKMDPIVTTAPGVPTGEKTIGADKAKAIGIKQAGGGIVTKCRLDYKAKKDILLYRVYVAKDNVEYKTELDARTGDILKATTKNKK